MAKLGRVVPAPATAPTSVTWSPSACDASPSTNPKPASMLPVTESAQFGAVVVRTVAVSKSSRHFSPSKAICHATKLAQAALTTAMGEATERPWSWRQSATLILETINLSHISNVTAVVVASIGGWCTPFANRTEHNSQVSFTVILVMQFCALGTLASTVAISFFLRRRVLVSEATTAAPNPLQFWQRTRIALRLSWPASVAATAFAGATVYGLMDRAELPLVEHNGHTLILVAAVAAHALITILQVVRFRQKATIRDPRPSITANDARNSYRRDTRRPTRQQLPHSSVRPPRAHHHALRRSMYVAIPTVFASFAGVQYVSFSKKLNLTSRSVVFAFNSGSLLLKFMFQLVVKVFISQSREQSVHNIFYMVTAPIVIIEMQIRMSLLLAQSTLSIYVSSAMLACVEIVIRITAVFIDFVVLEMEFQRVAAKKQHILVRHSKRFSHAAYKSQSSQSRRLSQQSGLSLELIELDERFRTWKNHHLRLCAIEIRAEILSEYCGLAFASILTAILSRNSSFQLGAIATIASSTQTTSLTNQVAAFLIQMGFELGADILASAIEMRLGIPLVDAISRNERDYIVFVVFVVAVHAGAMCISSFAA